MATSAQHGTWRTSRRPQASTDVPLDIAEMRRRLGDDETRIADVVILFLENYPSRLDALQAAVDAGDGTSIRRIARAIRGGASNLAATDVVNAAVALETICGTGNTQAISDGFGTLVAEVRRLAAALSSANSDGAE